MSDYNTNSVEILSKVINDSNYIKIFTNVNGNFVVGDYVYISSLNSNDINADLDNFINYFLYSGETIQGQSFFYLDGDKYTQGYEVLSVDTTNNGITINREYSTLKDYAELTPNNFYIGKTYFVYSEIDNSKVNSTILKNSKIGLNGDVEWIQGVLFDGVVSNLNIVDKYDSKHISLNSEFQNENGNVVSKYSYNNNGYGYSLFYGFNNAIVFSNTTINNGFFNNCILNAEIGVSGEDLTKINNGYFKNCEFNNIFIINNGNFVDSRINSIDTIWNYGIFDSSSSFTDFKPQIWYDGIWYKGSTPLNLKWLNGSFYGDSFSDSCEWENGEFNGNEFNGTVWKNGSFNKGVYKSVFWNNGIFNSGTFSSTSTWKTGVFNGGTFSGTWLDGIFNGGVFNGLNWTTGIFNGGVFSSGTWLDGEFNGGSFENGTSVWRNGSFYNGDFKNSNWDNGDFYNGNLINTTWLDGTFHYGTMYSVIWRNGTVKNCISYNSDFDTVTWVNGIFNGGNFAKVSGQWDNGSFNDGVFLVGGTFNSGYFYGGVFEGTWLGGVFYTGTTSTVPPEKRLNYKYEPFKKDTIIRSLTKKLTPKIAIGVRK